MGKKFGLVLGAGGSRGVSHIGFLKALDEAEIKPDCIAGSSMGAVVGSCYALGMKPDEMYQEIKALTMLDIFDLSANPLKNGALLKANKMRKKLTSYLGKKTFDDLKIPFKCVAVDMISGKAVSMGGDMNVAECVAASSSIPGVFKAVERDGMLLVDGGIQCRIPFEEVLNMGAEAVVAVDVLGEVRAEKRLPKEYNLLRTLSRIIDIMDSNATSLRIDKFKPDLLIRPNLGDMSQYKFKGIDKAFEVGYKIGKRNISKIRNIIQ